MIASLQLKRYIYVLMIDLIDLLLRQQLIANAMSAIIDIVCHNFALSNKTQASQLHPTLQSPSTA